MNFTVTPWDVKGEVDYDNDPLLNSEKLKYYTNKDFLNIYRMLYSYNPQVNSLLIQYKINRESRDYILNRLYKKFGKNINLISNILLKNLEKYRNKNYASKYKEKNRIKNNLLNGNITLEYARVISLMLSRTTNDSIYIFNEIIKNSKYIIIRGNKTKIPFNSKKLNNKLSYLCGIICGDGHISKDFNEIVIADGTKNIRLLHYSKTFFENLNKLFIYNFDIKGTIKKVKNYYTLRLESQFISRLMNYFYEIPDGKKCEIIHVPKIIKNTGKETLYWRGIFDTDGHARIKNKAIGFTTKSYLLSNDFLEFSNKNKLNIFNKHYTDKNIIKILISEESILKFAKIIGFSHPRKQLILIDYLKSGSSYNIPIAKIKNKKLDQFISYLRPYKNQVYIRLTEKREMVSSELLKERIKSIESILNVNVVQIKRNRKNNHFYICSKKLAEKIKEYYDFVPSWRSLDEKNVNKLRETWSFI
ncbi:LAGLIDADG family homing endonuclease [Candidatus Woesearchaeota archaeon]|nr:LAGLIDADG family homing endonuclease [Candidatus Woesearchaeota archaeon]